MVPRIRSLQPSDGREGSELQGRGDALDEILEVHSQAYSCGGGLWSAMGYCTPTRCQRPRRFQPNSETQFIFRVFQEPMDPVPEDTVYAKAEDPVHLRALASSTEHLDKMTNSTTMERSDSNVSSLFQEESMAGESDTDQQIIFKEVGDAYNVGFKWSDALEWGSAGSYCSGLTKAEEREFRGNAWQAGAVPDFADVGDEYIDRSMPKAASTLLAL